MGKKCLVYQPRAPAHWYLLVSIIIYDKQFLVASLEYSPRPVSYLFYIKTLIVSRWFTLLDVSCLSYFERKKNSHNKHKENKAYTMKFRRLYFQDNWICIHVMFFFFFFLLFLTIYNLLFTITTNNFSDSDDNKRKWKKIEKDAIQSRCPLMPYSLVLIAIRWFALFEAVT